MSDVKHSFRITIFDIEEEKVMVDEFCDAVIAGIATNGCKPGFTDNQEIIACKCGLLASTAAVDAAEKAVMTQKKADSAEKAVMTQKKQILKSFMKKATPEMIKECFGGENEDEC